MRLDDVKARFVHDKNISVSTVESKSDEVIEFLIESPAGWIMLEPTGDDNEYRIDMSVPPVSESIEVPVEKSTESVLRDELAVVIQENSELKARLAVSANG